MKRKSILAVVALVMLLCSAVGGTLAWITAQTRPITNTFETAEVTAWVDETFENGTKSNVTVRNTGDIPAYIRAAVVINWVNEDGNVLGTPVEEGDYTGFTSDPNWSKVGMYYYYTRPVPAGESTNVLIDRIAPVAEKIPEGWNLQVTILAEAIQAQGGAIRDAWPDAPDIMN